MIYLQLFYEFFKIGLFSFGGGYATIPFLFHISEVYNWYSLQELSQITAVASVTPGPVGINAATYAGLKTAGLFGAFVATFAEVLPSLILVIFVSKMLQKFRDNFFVNAIADSLKPIGCALLLSVGVGLLKPQISDIKGMILLMLLLVLSIKAKRSTLFYILTSAFIGVVLTVFSII